MKYVCGKFRSLNSCLFICFSYCGLPNLLQKTQIAFYNETEKFCKRGGEAAGAGAAAIGEGEEDRGQHAGDPASPWSSFSFTEEDEMV